MVETWIKAASLEVPKDFHPFYIKRRRIRGARLQDTLLTVGSFGDHFGAEATALK